MACSSESEALRKHFSELASLLKDVSEWLATELYSSSMITLETLDDVVTTMGVSSLHKARALLCALQRSFAEQPPSERAANFNRFLDILKKEQALHCIGSRVEATYKSLSVCINGCHVRGETQEPNALNGRSLASSPHEGQPSNHGHQEGAASSGELPAGSSNHSTSDTSSRPTARVQTGRRIAVTTAAPAHELDQAQRPSRRSRPRYHHSRASRSKRPHSAKRKHQGKAAKSSSSSSSSRRSSASSSDRSRHGRHCSHRRRRSSSLEEFLVSPFPTCSATPAKYLVKKIRKGKFTNFDCLLGPGIEEGSNALQLQGKRVGETKASKRRVVDLSSWMEAWTVFLAIRVQTAPQTALQLVKYQAIITQLFLSYPASVCIKYDSAFRQAVARDKANLIPWDQVKEDILVWCATRQPFRLSKQGSPTTGSTTTCQANFGSATQSGSHATQIATGQEICRRFNYSYCTRANCNFAHKCWTIGCGEDHPGKSCPRTPAPPG